jgi:hypothetical protein
MQTTNRVGMRLLAAAAACGVLAACTSGAGLKQSERTNMPLNQKLVSLEQRKLRLEDLNAIKRLQSAYGYYLDQGLWDQAASLFADDGSIEYALDGVYAGKQRVRQYLYAQGGGKVGLAQGQLNEHMLIMPVITLAADGQTAKGTWRDIIMTGHLGKDAFWGEGPYENDYVKVNGTWKIRRIHWFQTLLVPYEGGWAKHDDVNGGKYVSASLPPDAPPTVSYRPWPGAFTPPFHFRGPLGQPTEPATGLRPTQSSGTPPEGAHSNGSASLAKQAAQLAHDIQLLQDQNDIENLQQMYGYYIDKGKWDQAANLFCASATLEIQGRGAYMGRPRVLEYLRAIGPEGPAEGRLFDNMQLQPLIHVAPDRQHAKGRWRLFAQLAQSQKFHEWGVGVYENEYIREGGQWKISKLHLYPTLYTPYEKGWGKEWEAYSRFEPNLKPDRAGHAADADEQHRARAPFHYGNPVTTHAEHGKPSTIPDAASIDSVLSDLDHQVSRLEDVAEIKNLQATYGYYLATLLWDDLADKFARDGTIEIALRGVYVGKAAVRRNLNLYGQQGLDQGVLHNHMQFQPVIDVAEDGRTARIRSRAFSMMGNAGRAGNWMGGVYENELVKEDGEWKFQKDQVMNTYFAPYDVGWKDLPARPAPGVTESNPPDRPPSFHFDMYPKSFLPPYHYPDPVASEPERK